jgi:hypothetical protein
MVAVIVSVGLAVTVGSAPGQSSSAKRQEAPVEAANPDLATADRAQPDQAPDPDQVTPDLATADQAQPDQAPPEEPAADQAASDQAKPEEPAADQAASNQPKPEEPAKPNQPEATQPAPKQVVATPHGTPEEQQLQKETTRLLQLVQELKAEVAKAGSNTLSLTAVHKADEVLKLSKDLKERMKERGLVPQSRTQ